MLCWIRSISRGSRRIVMSPRTATRLRWAILAGCIRSTLGAYAVDPLGTNLTTPTTKSVFGEPGDAGNAYPTVRPHQTSHLLLRIDYVQTRFERRGLQLSIRGDECELPGVGFKLLFQHQS